MKTALQAFTDFVTLHGFWAGPAFGLLAFGESLAVVGTIIPATPLLFLIGIMLGKGLLHPLAVLPWAVAGAITGYWMSWAVGSRLGPSVYRHRLFGGQRRAIARVRLFFRRWGGPALIVGRFVLGPVQSMLPLVAGVAAMTPRRFHRWNAVSGVLWVCLVVTPGYIAARGFNILGFDEQTQQGLVMALALLSLLLILLVVATMLFRWIRYAQR